MIRPSERDTHERSLKIRISTTNSSKETLPLYTKKIRREKTTEFQRYTNPTYLALYRQIQKLRQTLITQLNTIQNLSKAIKTSTEEVAQKETNINLFTR
jgi:hypothetical protein